MNNLGTQKLNTERLILRRFETSDSKELFAGYINQPEFLYYANKQKMKPEDVESYLSYVKGKYEDNGYYNWAITQKEDGRIIGAINLKVEEGDSVLFSYAIDNRFTGRGYMSEALAVVRDYALEKLEVSAFIGGCVTKNIASKKVMEKCGLKYEKTIKNHKELSDGKHDMDFYSIYQNKKQ